MKPSKNVHEWSKQALFSKAQRYAETMQSNEHTSWEFGLWSALTLEMLVRASLANISPTLVADGKDWNNLLYAVGQMPNQAKFTPKSAGVEDLLKRAESMFPEFTRELLNFCVSHVNRRNGELHSGALPFDGLGSSSWLPGFYTSAKILSEAMGESLESLLGKSEADDAKEHIAALADENAKTVKSTINAHKTIWNDKAQEEKDTLSQQATTLSNRHYGHRVPCPSCKNTALVKGNTVGSPKTVVEESQIVEKHTTLPSSFECVACGLKISGYSKLVAAGLGDSYTTTYNYDAVEYFDIDVQGEIEHMMYEDNNEP